MRKVFFLLGQLSDVDVEWLISQGSREQVSAGATLIQAGQPAQALYILLEGTLSVAVPGLADAQGVRLGCGEIVGEMSFVDARPPSATVQALDNAVVLAIPHDKLAAKLDRDTAFAARFYRSLSQFLSHRLRSTYQRLNRGLEQDADAEVDDPDALDPNVFDQVHLAGARFERVLQQLLAR